MFSSRHWKQQRERGATLIEVLIAIALSGILLPALATALLTAHANKATPSTQFEAQQLMHEAQDALRSMREASWDNVASNGTFHPVTSGGGWTLVSGSETVHGFTRSITIGDVQRDSGGAIVASGGSVDPSTRAVTTTVSWSYPSPRSLESTIYLTRWLHSNIWEQTTDADFNTGTLNSTTTTHTADGEIVLTGGPGSYAATGTFESSTYDAGSEVGWQRLQLAATTPGDSSLRLQLATNTDNHTWNYLGPDGTSGSYFTADSPLPATIGRYMRYKVLFSATTGVTDTPVLSLVRLEYTR